MWLTLLFLGTAAVFLVMTFATLFHLQWARRLPALSELGTADPYDGANDSRVQCTVIVAAREGRRDHLGLVGKRIALDREPSGINSAIREGRAFTVYDAEHSAVVNQRLNAIARAKS